MRKVNLAYVVDDNKIALSISNKIISTALPNLKIVTFTRSEDMLEAVKNNQTPDIIFSDINMPGMNGLELLSWIRRNPKHHNTPIIFLSGETDPDVLKSSKQYGINGHCVKPLQVENVKKEFEKVEKKFLEFSIDKELEISFAEECLEISDTIRKILSDGEVDDQKVKELYRFFHTVKGVAASLNFPILAKFMHQSENFLSVVREGNTYKENHVKQILSKVADFLTGQSNSIISGEIMENINPEFFDLKQQSQVIDLEESVETEMPEKKYSPLVVNIEEIKKKSEVTKAESLRVKHKDLDHFQLKLKKILQIKVQMSTFARQLQGEFYDELFPKELIKLVSLLEENSLAAMESLIYLRVQSIDSIKPFCQNLLNELTKTLEKKCYLLFVNDGQIEVDMPVLELIKNAFTHIIRNSLDHGLETPQERLNIKKDEYGLLKIEISRLDKTNFKVTLQDDGRGINKEKLLDVLLKKNILSQEQTSKLSDDQVYQMIFVDGLSTKEEVTDISGRGVGLSAVKDDIEKIGGSIHVESVLDEGTKFVMIMPIFFIL